MRRREGQKRAGGYSATCAPGASGPAARNTVDRRVFTGAAALALLGGASIVLSGCGTAPVGPDLSSPGVPLPSPSAAPDPAADKTGAISSNHGHLAVLSAAAIARGGGLTLDIMGQTLHTHAVTLTADEVGQIAAGGQVSRETTGRTHTHTVTFN